MNKIISFICCLLIFLTTYSQTSINTVLHLNENHSYYKTKFPKKTIENITFFNRSGNNSTLESIKNFDPSGMLVKEEDNSSENGLQSILIFVYDTANKLVLSRTLLRKSKYINSEETAEFIYENNQLVKWIDKDKNGNILFTTEIKNDSKGKPIELLGYDNRGNTYGKEIAEYDYDNNTATISVFSNNSSLLSETKVKINYNMPSKNEVYNDNKSLVKWSDDRNNMYEAEYKYDKFGNITEMKTYSIKVNSNNKQKRHLERVLKKEYFY